MSRIIIVISLYYGTRQWLTVACERTNTRERPRAFLKEKTPAHMRGQDCSKKRAHIFEKAVKLHAPMKLHSGITRQISFTFIVASSFSDKLLSTFNPYEYYLTARECPTTICYIRTHVSMEENS